MEIKWLSQASQDLDNEMNYLSKEDPELSIRLFNLILEKVSMLAEYPHIGRASKMPHVRELVINEFPYILPYRVKNNVVQILAVFHTSRKPPKHWK